MFKCQTIFLLLDMKMIQYEEDLPNIQYFMW